MSESVEIIVYFTAEDLAITTRHVNRRKPKRWKEFGPLLIFAILAFTVSFLANPFSNLRDLFHPRVLLVLLAVVVVAIAYYLLRQRRYGLFAIRYFQNLIDESRTLGHKKTIKFSESGVQFTDRFSTSKVSWEAYTEIQETEDYLYFYTAPTSAQIFPKRAFSEHGIEMLRLLLRSYLPPDRNVELLA